MITQLEYQKALKIVNNYQSQFEIVNWNMVSEDFKLENHFRSNAVKALQNCYHETFGVQKENLNLEDLSKLNINQIYRFRGFGQKSELKLKELLSNFNKKQL